MCGIYIDDARIPVVISQRIKAGAFCLVLFRAGQARSGHARCRGVCACCALGFVHPAAALFYSLD
jgi:hypothetical protein